MKESITIRPATPEDGEGILKIYAPYIEHTAITFEYLVPSLEEFTGRIQKTLKRYPYLVAEKEGEILGYAYSGPLKERAAYNWAVETTLYIRQDQRRQGLGRRLYAALEIISKAQNITNLNACIACPEQEDEYLTRDSINFHTRMGYSLIGEFHKCGYKFGHWYNMVWMEKIIKPHLDNPPEMIPFPRLLSSGFTVGP